MNNSVVWLKINSLLRILIHQETLAVYEPQLGQPAVDMLKDSNLPNLRKFISRGNGSHTGSFSHLTPADVQLSWSVGANLAANLSAKG